MKLEGVQFQNWTDKDEICMFHNSQCACEIEQVTYCTKMWQHIHRQWGDGGAMCVGLDEWETRNCAAGGAWAPPHQSSQAYSSKRTPHHTGHVSIIMNFLSSGRLRKIFFYICRATLYSAWAWNRKYPRNICFLFNLKSIETIIQLCVNLFYEN